MIKIKQWFFNSSGILKNTAQVFLGNVLTSLFVLIFSVLVSRHLGPADFGVFSVVLAVLTMVSDISDFGANTGMVKFASEALENNDADRAARIITLNLKFKFYAGLLVGGAGYVMAPWLATAFFHNSGLAFPLKLAFLGILGIMIFSFFLAVFQAYRQFTRRIFWALFLAIGRLAGLLILLWLSAASIINSIMVYILVPVILFGPVFWKKPFKFIREKITDKKLSRDLFHFGKWLTLANLAVLILSRLDIFLLTRWSGVTTAGIYSAAFRLASFILLINSSFTVTLLPEVFRLKSPRDIWHFFLKLILIIGTVCLCLTPLVFLGPALIKMIYGASYVSAGPVFQILVLAFMAMVAISALEMIIYALNRPDLFAILMVISLGLSLAGNYLLIPILGARGAALTLLGLKVFGIIYLITAIVMIFTARRAIFNPESRPAAEDILNLEENAVLD